MLFTYNCMPLTYNVKAKYNNKPIVKHLNQLLKNPGFTDY